MTIIEQLEEQKRCVALQQEAIIRREQEIKNYSKEIERLNAKMTYSDKLISNYESIIEDIKNENASLVKRLHTEKNNRIRLEEDEENWNVMVFQHKRTVENYNISILLFVLAIVILLIKLL